MGRLLHSKVVAWVENDICRLEGRLTVLAIARSAATTKRAVALCERALASAQDALLASLRHRALLLNQWAGNGR
jgi:hypothetical protein